MMKLLLGPILGHTTHESACIWAHTNFEAAGGRSLAIEMFRDAAAGDPIPGSPFPLQTRTDRGNTGTANIPLPEPGRRYYYRVTFQGACLHPEIPLYSFIAPPAPSERLNRIVFAFASCHNPPKSGLDRATRLWRALYAEMVRADARFLILMGDQVYADEPKDGNVWKQALAVSGSEAQRREQRLSLYRGLYRRYWDHADFRRVMASFPTYMIWDDHEIVNGWGSEEEHRQAAQQEVFAAARQVYDEFQQSHNPPPLVPGGRHYAFRVGPAAFLVLDLRGHREVWTPQLLGDTQKDSIETYLAGLESDVSVLFVVSSVPLFHLTRRFACIPLTSDITDQWSSPPYKADRKWLLARLFAWMGAGGERQVFVLGGDVHVGTVGEAVRLNTGQRLVQVTSSPITNKPARCLDIGLSLVSHRFTIHLDDAKQDPVEACISRRYPQRNFALGTIDLAADPARPVVRFEMHWEGKKNPDPYPGGNPSGPILTAAGGADRGWMR